MSAFRAYYARNIRSDLVSAYLPDTSNAFVQGDLIYYDTSTDKIRLCGANPSLIAAVAEAPSTAVNLDLVGKLPIRRLQADDVIAFPSDTDFDGTYVGDSLDISYASAGVWKVLTTTSNPRVLVVGGVAAAENVDGAIWFCQVLATYCQFDAVAS
jgi:hypothetical protein